MKTKTLTKIVLTSVLCAPACAVERGVIIYRQGLPEENALYVNLIKKDKSEQKPMFVQSDGMFDADRKLFFTDSAYIEPFMYALPGDTISFQNALHETYLDMGPNKKRVIDINGVKERKIIKIMRPIIERHR